MGIASPMQARCEDDYPLLDLLLADTEALECFDNCRNTLFAREDNLSPAVGVLEGKLLYGIGIVGQGRTQSGGNCGTRVNITRRS